jgi:hypothetical protein
MTEKRYKQIKALLIVALIGLLIALTSVLILVAKGGIL